MKNNIPNLSYVGGFVGISIVLLYSTIYTPPIKYIYSFFVVGFLAGFLLGKILDKFSRNIM
jgi:uncharacterized membrane protein YdcZ (DUF606 family)